MPVFKYITILVKIFFFAAVYIYLRLTTASPSTMSSHIHYGAEFITLGALYCAIYIVFNMYSEELQIQAPEAPVLTIGFLHWTFVILNLRTVVAAIVTTVVVALIPESYVIMIVNFVHPQLEQILNSSSLPY